LGRCTPGFHEIGDLEIALAPLSEKAMAQYY